MDTSSESEVAPIDQFPNNFFRHILESTEQNVIFSPLTTYTMLALIYQGAKGATKNTLASILHFPDQESLAQEYEIKMKTLTNLKNITLNIANKIFVRADLTLKKNFESIAINNFLTETQLLDVTDPDQSVKVINEWVEEKTNGKIKDLANKTDIDDGICAILLSAIYFNGKWLTPFKLRSTGKEKFYLTSNKSIEVDMMHSNNVYLGFKRDRFLEAKVLQLPYINRDVYMLVILPDDIDGIKEVEHKLLNMDLSRLDQDLHAEKVIVYLPKFKIECTIDLKEDVLKHVGLEIILDPKRAEFGDMLENIGNKIYVWKAVQKTFIEVNEVGTEAAAADKFVKRIIKKPRIVRVCVNHPFLILLKERNNILFMGRIQQPL